MLLTQMLMSFIDAIFLNSAIVNYLLILYWNKQIQYRVLHPPSFCSLHTTPWDLFG